MGNPYKWEIPTNLFSFRVNRSSGVIFNGILKHICEKKYCAYSFAAVEGRCGEINAATVAAVCDGVVALVVSGVTQILY